MNALTVAHVECSEPLIRQVADACKAAGLSRQPLQIDSGRALRGALDAGLFDLIIIGHAAPGIVAPDVVRLVWEQQPGTPCLVVIDRDDAELDALALEAGAAECVTAQSLPRLARNIRRVLADTEDRAQRERHAVEAANLEARFQQTQRLAAIGKLASGLAHDFNNLLTIINGYAEQLLGQLGPQHELHALVEPIWKAGTSGAQLTRRLLLFGRPSSGATSGVELNALVSDLQPMLARLLGESICLALDLDAHLWPVRADPAEMAQVLINLATNARDAMPGGGTLTLATANAALPTGSWVDLIVRDTGLGMDDDVRSHLFEPFFTTKPQGLGTGLGLASVRAIVEEHGGDVHIETEVGRGTAVRVRVPREAGAPVQPPSSLEDEVGTSTEDKVVLLVEDDSGVREIIARFLRSGGYDVVEASTAAEAQALVGAGRRRPDVLLTDVVLPDDSGPRLADTLSVALPGLKTLFISGYPAEAIAQFGARSGLTFLVKPFSRATLLRRLHETLRFSGANAD
jgi:two-component system cell cycle sensor histidine kinase/response regulator CckA